MKCEKLSRVVLLWLSSEVLAAIAGTYIYKRYLGAHCLEGQSVGTTQAANVAECGYKCEHTEWCSAFTYFKENSTCSLKHPVSTKTLHLSPTDVPGCLFFYKVFSLVLCFPKLINVRKSS